LSTTQLQEPLTSLNVEVVKNLKLSPWEAVFSDDARQFLVGLAKRLEMANQAFSARLSKG
jgi:hypothetical protein